MKTEFNCSNRNHCKPHKKIVKHECFHNLNTDTTHLHDEYSQLNTKQKEITKSDYVYSIIEHMNDHKQLLFIKNEMKKNQKNNIINTQFYLTNKNIFNYKDHRKEREAFNLKTEAETLDLMLNKFETIYTKKLYNSLRPKKKKVKSIIPLTTLSPPQRIEVKRKIKCDNDNDLQLSKSLSFKVNNCQRVNYLRNTLTSSLYNILQNAEEKENEIKQSQNDIMKEINLKYKTNLKASFNKTDIIKTKLHNTRNNNNFNIPKYNTLSYNKSAKITLPLITEIRYSDRE